MEREEEKFKSVCTRPICPAHNKCAKNAKEFALLSERERLAFLMIRIASVRAAR
jgi:hypothetical protein